MTEITVYDRIIFMTSFIIFMNWGVRITQVVFNYFL